MDNEVAKEPYELFGVECGEGWSKLYIPLFEYIEKYNADKSNDDKIEVLQVKEKFGGLRFYTNFTTEELDEMISNAEEESYHTCENCGSQENVGYDCCGWIYTNCFKCVVERAKKYDKPIRWCSNDDNKKYLVYGDGHKEEYNKKML